MNSKLYIPPAGHPVSPAPLALNTLIALAVYAAFLVGLYAVGMATLVERMPT
jgi:hypothetical protein